MTPEEEQEFRRARSRRSWVIALGLFAFVVLVFVVTLVRLGGAIVERPL